MAGDHPPGGSVLILFLADAPCTTFLPPPCLTFMGRPNFAVAASPSLCLQQYLYQHATNTLYILFLQRHFSVAYSLTKKRDFFFFC